MSNVTNLNGSVTHPTVVREAGRTVPHHGTARRHGDDNHPPEVHVRPADSVDISALARRLGERSTGEPVRQDLVDRVKGEIENGTYESDDKLDLAAERLLGDLDTIA